MIKSLQGRRGSVPEYLTPIDSKRRDEALLSLAELGFCSLDGVLSSEGHQRLKVEAIAQLNHAHLSRSDSVATSGAYLSDLGTEALKYLNSSVMGALLKELVGDEYRLDKTTSCYTYYSEGGYISPHLDLISGGRPISVLTYLLVVGDVSSDNSGLHLDVYKRSPDHPTSQRARIPTREASIVIGYGTEVFHGRSPLRSEERLIMMNGSFALKAG